MTDKVKSPKLDNNGPGLPPYDGDGHGGNGGGGGNFSVGLILLGILGVLDVLKDIEKQWQRKHNRWSWTGYLWWEWNYFTNPDLATMSRSLPSMQILYRVSFMNSFF